MFAQGHPWTIFDLDKDEQQALIDRLNSYLSFEMGRTKDIKSVCVCVDGYGGMFAAIANDLTNLEVAIPLAHSLKTTLIHP